MSKQQVHSIVILLVLVKIITASNLLFSKNQIDIHQIEYQLTHEIYPRLSEYYAGPLFAYMSGNNANFGTKGLCAHTTLWLVIWLE